jgi:hypothetical protein
MVSGEERHPGLRHSTGIGLGCPLLVALIVVFTFFLVSLSGMEHRGIKEAPLAVIAFYFSSAKKK